MLHTDHAILKHARQICSKVNSYSSQMESLSDDDFPKMTLRFKERIADGESLDDLEAEAFALVREAAFRILGQKPYDEQVIGAAIMHQGDIAEMHTGSGKTLTVTMPVYLSALEGNGVHVITVNEYLATRDASWMGQVYRFLGLSVGVNLHSLTPEEKREAFLKDITYTINSELGFDYLRDNMVSKASDRVLRGLHYVFIDEIDSVLIDDARTPLIISGATKASASLYELADRFAKRLKPPVYADDDFSHEHLLSGDYEIDTRSRSVYLSEEGIHKAERFFKTENLYDPAHASLNHAIAQALKANFAMKKDVEYILKDQDVLLVDPSTGRAMDGREFSDGLQQAIQAKEGAAIQKEHQTSASITYQNFFRLYKRLSGMTGTAKTEEEEFLSTYNMRVIPVPDHRPVIRKDYPDKIYLRQKDKYRAIVNEAAMRHHSRQPVLIGTPSVEVSMIIDTLLNEAGLDHTLLNALNDAAEAEIIADAGKPGAITVATNMAGRGTDIKLTRTSRSLGGLAVIGVERHDSRRIDQQLQGRSGRQGDPGISQFYVSLEDPLIQRFGDDKLKSRSENDPKNSRAITSRFLSRMVTEAQKRVEGAGFDARKRVLEYDEILRRQRESVYQLRNELLDQENIHPQITDMMQEYACELQDHTDSSQELGARLGPFLENVKPNQNLKALGAVDLGTWLVKSYENRTAAAGEKRNVIEKNVMLQILDRLWMEHMEIMTRLRNSISLRSYGQNRPLEAYIQEGYSLYENMIRQLKQDTVSFLLMLSPAVEERSG